MIVRKERSDHFLLDGPQCHGRRGCWFEKRLARYGDFGVSKLVVSLYLHAFDGLAYVSIPLVAMTKKKGQACELSEVPEERFAKVVFATLQLVEQRWGGCRPEHVPESFF